MKRDENKKKSSSQPEPAEPTVGNGGSPIWLLAVLGLLFYWGTLYLDANGGGFNNQVYGQYASSKEVELAQPKDLGGYDKATGERVFTQICSLCHQASGMGAPGQFPPLVGSEWVQSAGPNRMIRIVLNGLTGPLKVKGEAWNHSMVGVGSQLTDKEIAAVLSFVRSRKDWGHSGSIVKPEQVTAIRAIVGERGQWTSDELEKIPESN